MFGNRDGSVLNLLLCLVTVTVLPVITEDCIHGSSLRNFVSHGVLPLQKIFAGTE